MNNRKIIKYLMLAVVISLVLPIAIDFFVFGNNLPSNISNEVWAGFLGSYIGGVCTVIAMFLTIIFTNKINAENYEKQFQREMEIRKSSIKPYLSAYQDIIKPEDIFGDNDRFFEVCNEKVATMRYSVELQKVKDIYRKQEDTYSLKYCVRNEGAGNAVSMMIKINDYNVETGLIKGEKMNLYLKIKLDDKSDKKYHFLFTYWDVEHLCCYTQENTLVFTWNNEDMDWEFKPLRLSKPKLIDEEK